MALSNKRVLNTVLVAVLLGAPVPVFGLVQYLDRRHHEHGLDPCAAVVTPETSVAGFPGPYGAIYSCRVIDGGATFFDDAELRYTVVLETQRGPALVSLGFYPVDSGPEHVMVTVELDPKEEHLPDAEVARIRTAINERGGLKGRWTVGGPGSW